MLYVRHEEQVVVVSWDGSLDRLAADLILSTVALINLSDMIVLDLSKAVVDDSALARLEETLTPARPLRFRGLGRHHERLLGYLRGTQPPASEFSASASDGELVPPILATPRKGKALLARPPREAGLEAPLAGIRWRNWTGDSEECESPFTD